MDASASGILHGSYSLRAVPGYAYGNIAINQFRHQEPATSAVVKRRAGRMGFSYLADHTETEGKRRHVIVSLGEFVIPLFGPATLTVRVAPVVSFAFWAVPQGAAAWTLGGLTLKIEAYRLADGTHEHNDATTFQSLWNQPPIVEDIAFDFGSLTAPLTVRRTVDTAHFYLVSLDCVGAAGSNVFPDVASSSGGMLDLTLPFIDLSVEYQSVATPE